MDPDIRQTVQRLNEGGGSYHRIELGPNLVLERDYDISPVLGKYGFPEDLSGQRVLDVGTATGYFALEFARRGADVTAIDLWKDHPLPKFAKALGLRIRYIPKDVLDLDISFGSFDLVFLGSVLLHLWDPFKALRRCRSVCQGRIIVATAISSPCRLLRDLKPLVQFVGEKAETAAGEYWFTWKPNRTAVLAMLERAGFTDSRYCGSFLLRTLPGRPRFAERHGIFHAQATASHPKTRPKSPKTP